MTKAARKSTIDLAEFHARLSSGKRPRSAVRLAQPGSPVADSKDRVVSFVFSDGSVDRYGDTIDARGWVLDNYAANPVALFGHDANSVENVIGRARNVRVMGSALVGEIEFAAAEVNPNAETVYQMVKGGYLSTVSVGFQPLDWAPTKDKARPGGVDFKKQELLEISIVPVPANPNAVALARAAGIEVDRLKIAERESSPPPVDTRDAAPLVSKKGLYEVSWLARLLADLGYLEEMVEWEADYEGDGSAVPQMLTDAMNQLGAALVAMTVEEVAELLADDEGDEAPLILIDDPILLSELAPAQRAFVALAKAGPHAAMNGDRRYIVHAEREMPPTNVAHVQKCITDWLAGKAPSLILPPGLSLTVIEKDGTSTRHFGGDGIEVKAGKVLSAANEKVLRDAHDMITKGCGMIKGMIDPEADTTTKNTEAAARFRKAKALKQKVAFAAAA